MTIPALEKTDLGKVPVLSQHSQPDEKINVQKFAEINKLGQKILKNLSVNFLGDTLYIFESGI